MVARFRFSLISMTLFGLLGSPFAFAGDLSQEVSAIRDRWAEVNYQVPKDDREDAFAALADEAAKVKAAAPKDPSALIWEGIVLSSYAGARGGLGALSLTKQARADFESAIALDPNALDGSAQTSLGVLYYQVPGWPIGFGDDDKARELLSEGLKANPDGIDANYFFADFLSDQGDWQGAATALEKALNAPARPGRELADQGRRDEINVLLSKVREHLSDS
ncbi:hypothetical protein C7S18_08745 [Ahniella affigens]|uniref:Uncharacterized protein n=1 Tax=Ahniella affigens TaxID=2021234 RepID=A0A2P1PR15_9GAMM|nr:hypothetical protein [Ahniella affigens]AVP97274.1 hypothetical protein C7S18_08745 [Ahniella affigens]